MAKKHLFTLIFAVFSAVQLSACSSWMDKQLMQSEVKMRDDAGTVVTTPMSQYVQNDSSVEIFSLGDQNTSGSMAVMPSTGGQASQGVQSMADSSVTIFPLDGGMPSGVATMGGMQNNNYMPSMMNNGGGNSFSGGGAQNQIFFKHGSSRLGGGDLRKLSNVAEEAKFAPVNRITVAGHASRPTQAGSQTVTGNILNLKESMNRSFAVSRSLMKKGVPAEKIKTVSWGSTKPTGNDRQDRRVDIIMGEQ